MTDAASSISIDTGPFTGGVSNLLEVDIGETGCSFNKLNSVDGRLGASVVNG